MGNLERKIRMIFFNFFKAPMDSKLTPAVTDTLSYLGTLLDIKIVKDKM